MSMEKGFSNRAVVRLHLENDELNFVVHRNGSVAQVKRSWVVSVAQLRNILRHEPPTVAELETTIATVEDLVIPVIRTLPPGADLEISGSAMKGVIDELRAFSGHHELSIEQVELLFNRLVDAVNGTPVAMLGISVNVSFTMSLAVLREVMHHGGYHMASALF